MSTRVPQRRRPSAREVAREAESQRRKRNQTLDLLNALVTAFGGEVTLTFEQVDDIPRRPVTVDIDHEKRVVRLRSEGATHASVRQRLARTLV